MNQVIPNFKNIRTVSPHLRKAAQGQDCKLRMPWCNNNPETTVHCHIRAFGLSGVNCKPEDIHGYHGCSECHRRENGAGSEDLLRALMLSKVHLIQVGIISVTGSK